MGWVNKALVHLGRGENAEIRPHGGSMKGRIESGQLVTLAPASFYTVDVGDVVFVKWKGNYLLHLIKEKNETEILIANNMGKTNGWVSGEAIIAKVVDIKD